MLKSKLENIVFNKQDYDVFKGKTKQYLNHNANMKIYNYCFQMYKSLCFSFKDLPNAMPVNEISDALDLNNINSHSWYIQSNCGTNGDGLYEGLDWLSEKCKSSQKG